MSVLLFSKFQNDFFLSNGDIAALCGMRLRELNGLEVLTLHILDFKLLISQEEFEVYDNRISEAFSKYRIGAFEASLGCAGNGL